MGRTALSFRIVLAEDVSDDLGNVARLLAAIRNLDPINQPQDRQRPTNLLQELNSGAPERLNELLLLLRKKARSPLSSKRDFMIRLLMQR